MTHAQLGADDPLGSDAQLVLSPDTDVERATEAAFAAQALVAGMDMEGLQTAPVVTISRSDLTALPEIFGQLSALSTLDLTKSSIAAPPESFGHRPALHTL